MKDISEGVSFARESISAASGNIAASPLRSWITASIIALGVASLVGTQTAIDSLSSVLSSAFGGKVCNSFTISKVSGDRQSTLSHSCIKLFEEHFDPAESAATYTYLQSLGGIHGPGGELFPGCVASAFDGDYMETNALSIRQGRRFSPLEEQNGAKVCLIGQKVAESLGEGIAIGQFLTIGGQCFKVVGIISGQLSFLGVIAENTVFVPVSAARGTLFNEKSSFNADILLASGTNSEDAIAMADALLRRIRHIPSTADADFELTQSDALKQEVDALSSKIALLALAVGLLTILGAAVGLTNIMLIAVKERTREIGLRRATGASKKAITLDIITEAALLCGYGCCAGILLGVIVGNILSVVLDTALQIPWDWVGASCAICAAVCTAASWLPAHKAAGMDPVAALRCE